MPVAPPLRSAQDADPQGGHGHQDICLPPSGDPVPPAHKAAELSDGALVYILLPLSILAKACFPAKISVAAANKTTPGWCHRHRTAASGTPLCLSPFSLWLSKGATEPRARLCLQSLVVWGTAGSAEREAVTPDGGGNKVT